MHDKKIKMTQKQEIIKEIAKKVKNIRKEKYKTQEIFANHIGMNYSKYARFEKSGQISFDGFVDILQGLGIFDEFIKLFKTQNLFEIIPNKTIQKNEIKIDEPKKEIIIPVENKEVVKSEIDEYNADIKRVVSIFDQERKKLQPSFVRKEYRNTDGEYLLRLHLKETKRTPQMFFDAIRWLFSNNPKAGFHRQYIMNIGKLIEHFNALEHQAMYSEEAVAFNDEARAWYNVYKKQGMGEEEIMKILKDAGYIK